MAIDVHSYLNRNGWKRLLASRKSQKSQGPKVLKSLNPIITISTSPRGVGLGMGSFFIVSTSVSGILTPAVVDIIKAEFKKYLSRSDAFGPNSYG